MSKISGADGFNGPKNRNENLPDRTITCMQAFIYLVVFSQHYVLSSVRLISFQFQRRNLSSAGLHNATASRSPSRISPVIALFDDEDLEAECIGMTGSETADDAPDTVDQFFANDQTHHYAACSVNDSGMRDHRVILTNILNYL